MTLIALGYRSLSLAPSAIGPVKAMALELDAGKAAAVVNELIARTDATGSVRNALTAFAEAEGVPL
jgi:phosphotransferase system enzyme I (PtsP)